MNPILSIIVPIYNMEQYLENCINSIISQTYGAFELILVDDGSTDGSSKICDRYISHRNIKVVHKPNGGLISARKAGIAVASGEYIGFVDADDWVEPEMYERLMYEAETHSVDIVSCGYFLDKGDSRTITRGTDEKNVIKSESERQIFFEGILAKGFDWTKNRNIPPSVCNKVFRKSLLENAYVRIDERIIWDEDTVTVLSTALNSKCIVLIPDALYHYRQNMTSISHKKNREVLQNYVYTFNELRRISDEHGGILDNQIPYFSLAAMRLALEVGFGVGSGKQYMFPFDKVKQGSVVIIYGAGQVGRSYYSELFSLDYASAVYITDSNSDSWGDDVTSSETKPEADETMTQAVVSPDEAFNHTYDVVLIAIENETAVAKIKKSLIDRGVPENKILWQKPIVLKDTYSFRMTHQRKE